MQFMQTHPTPLIGGLRFPEGPRWHDGAFWFSDMHARRVVRTDLSGNWETVLEVPDWVSGLGWLPDGRLLICAMQSRRLLRLDGDRLTEVADLTDVTGFHINDMVVDAKGRAYVGNFGFDLSGGEEPRPTNLVMVTPNGDVKVVAEDLVFPNGSVITPDGGTLIVGESFASRLTAFDVAEDGSLSNRRVWAELGEGVPPDGCCLDAEGALWVATPTRSEVIRVLEGGQVTQRIPVETDVFACMLGGPDRKTLMLCTAPDSESESSLRLLGRIETCEVDVPGVGLP